MRTGWGQSDLALVAVLSAANRASGDGGDPAAPDALRTSSTPVGEMVREVTPLHGRHGAWTTGDVHDIAYRRFGRTGPGLPRLRSVDQSGTVYLYAFDLQVDLASVVGCPASTRLLGCSRGNLSPTPGRTDTQSQGGRSGPRLPPENPRLTVTIGDK